MMGEEAIQMFFALDDFGTSPVLPSIMLEFLVQRGPRWGLAF